MKQQEVADALGVSRATYANYETGRRAPDIDTLIRLADFYGITLDELTGHCAKKAKGLQLTEPAMRLLKIFNQLPAAMQELYISHMTFDVKTKNYLLNLHPAVVAEKSDNKK